MKIHNVKSGTNYIYQLGIKVVTRWLTWCGGTLTFLGTRAYSRGVGVKSPPWAWYFTKTLLPAQRRL